MNDALKKAAVDASDFAKSLKEPVDSDARFVFEAKLLKDVWVRWKEAEENHKMAVADLKKQLAAIEMRDIMVIAPLRSISKQLKARLENFAEARVREQSRLLNLASQAALNGQQGDAARLTLEAEQVLPPTVAAIGVNRTFYAEVTDILALPEEFVNRVPRLGDIKKKSKAGDEIPGVVAGHKATVRVKINRG